MAFAEAGGAVVGICNGFQILCEAGLLPGALIRNRQLRFVCRWVDVRVETSVSPLSAGLVAGEVLRVPVKHGEGQFVASAADLDRIERDGLVVFRYCSPDGAIERARTTPTAPRTRSPGCATTRATWSGSCRTPSTPSTRTSAPPVVSRCSRRCSRPRWRTSPRERVRTAPPAARAHRRRARDDPFHPRPGPQPRRARDVRGDVVRALLLQVLEGPPAEPSDRGSLGARRPGAGRRRGRRRGRHRGRLQARVALAPLGGRALPGGGDRGRRDRARRDLDGRASDRAARSAAVRAARRRAEPVAVRGRRRGDRRLRQLHRRPHGGRRGAVRSRAHREPDRQRDVRRRRPGRPARHGRSRGARGLAAGPVRRGHRSRRHRRGVGAGVEHPGGGGGGATAERPDRRPVRRQAPDRGLASSWSIATCSRACRTWAAPGSRAP